MAGNPTPDDPSDLLAAAEDMADGLNKLEAPVGIKQNTESVIRGAIAGYRGAETALGAAKSALGTAEDGVETANTNAKTFLKAARKVLAHYLGDTWSAAWEATGFPNQSTAVPGSQEERLNLCASLMPYFTANSTHESEQFGVTAGKAEETFTALSNARDWFGAKAADATLKEQNLAKALKTLRRRVRGLIDELDTLLEEDDPRWHEFGLSMPADPDTPEKVTSLVLTPNMAGKVLAKWKRAPRGGRYRVYKQVLTVDAAPVNIVTVHDLETMLEALPSGKTVRVFIVAANNAGEAPPSDAVEIIVP
ncbi:MAG TPA: hypothetical protein VGF13_18395 [Verrucomicrobiae bacterium]|jgi:hypothetical protein